MVLKMPYSGKLSKSAREVLACSSKKDIRESFKKYMWSVLLTWLCQYLDVIVACSCLVWSSTWNLLSICLTKEQICSEWCLKSSWFWRTNGPPAQYTSPKHPYPSQFMCVEGSWAGHRSHKMVPVCGYRLSGIKSASKPHHRAQLHSKAQLTKYRKKNGVSFFIYLFSTGTYFLTALRRRHQHSISILKEPSKSTAEVEVPQDKNQEPVFF